MSTYYVYTDAVSTYVEAETPDAAARLFAVRQRIKGVTDVASLEAAIVESGGWGMLRDRDTCEIFMHVGS